MTRAAAEANISVQWCMSTPRYLLQVGSVRGTVASRLQRFYEFSLLRRAVSLVSSRKQCARNDGLLVGCGECVVQKVSNGLYHPLITTHLHLLEQPAAIRHVQHIDQCPGPARIKRSGEQQIL